MGGVQSLPTAVEVPARFDVDRGLYRKRLSGACHEAKSFAFQSKEEQYALGTWLRGIFEHTPSVSSAILEMLPLYEAGVLAIWTDYGQNVRKAVSSALSERTVTQEELAEASQKYAGLSMLRGAAEMIGMHTRPQPEIHTLFSEYPDLLRESDEGLKDAFAKSAWPKILLSGAVLAMEPPKAEAWIEAQLAKHAWKVKSITEPNLRCSDRTIRGYTQEQWTLVEKFGTTPCENLGRLSRASCALWLKENKKGITGLHGLERMDKRDMKLWQKYAPFETPYFFSHRTVLERGSLCVFG